MVCLRLSGSVCSGRCGRIVFRILGSFVISTFLLSVVSQMSWSSLKENAIVKQSPSWINFKLPWQYKPEREFKYWELTHPGDKFDWENDPKRTGNGENGAAYTLEQADENATLESYKIHGFSSIVSDHISYTRGLPDIRHPNCKTRTYLKELPTASVIIPFYNEHFATLLRTVHSLINRSPDNLKEIILVDNFSDQDALKDQLDDYVARHFTKIQIIRLNSTFGLAQAKMAGARKATGDVVIFLDSHSEVNINWLPPLLEPIATNYRTVACPFIDVIDHGNFAYTSRDDGARGGFDWNLNYKRLPLLPMAKTKLPEPYKNPVLSGVFAISNEYFNELGGFDEGLQVWGEEQFEISFKIWQCGGQILDVPCSRVGHIYRKSSPFKNDDKGDYKAKNVKRVAEVWMDEYKENIYKLHSGYRTIDAGDLSAQKAIRQKLQCQPFKWYMEQVAFDVPKLFPLENPPDFAWGEIRSKANQTLCVDTKFKKSGERFGLAPCLKTTTTTTTTTTVATTIAPATNGTTAATTTTTTTTTPTTATTAAPAVTGQQEFVLSWYKDIRVKNSTLCWDVPTGEPKAPVVLYSCHRQMGNQHFKYDPSSQNLIQLFHKRCLDYDPATLDVFVTNCDDKSQTQKWGFENFNQTSINDWDHLGQDFKL